MKQDKIDQLTTRETFFDFVNKCNTSFRLGTPSLYKYRQIIETHREYKDLSKLLDDPNFFNLIYDTLIAWDMNQRGAKLDSFENLKTSILNNKSTLIELYNYNLDSMTDEDLNLVLTKLEVLFKNLQVMNSKSKKVGVSKTLHFLLPDLVMPIDRAHTINVFYGYDKCEGNISQEFRTFKKIFLQFYKIAKTNQLTMDDVDNIRWNTSVPKLIDNAVIGMK